MVHIQLGTTPAPISVSPEMPEDQRSEYCSAPRRPGSLNSGMRTSTKPSVELTPSGVSPGASQPQPEQPHSGLPFRDHHDVPSAAEAGCVSSIATTTQAPATSETSCHLGSARM